MEILFIGDEQAIQTFVDQQLTSILFEPNESHTVYSVDIVSGAWKYLLDSINICRSSEYLDVECRKSADLVLLFNNNHKSILPHYIQVGNQNDIVNFEKKKKTNEIGSFVDFSKWIHSYFHRQQHVLVEYGDSSVVSSAKNLINFFREFLSMNFQFNKMQE